MAFVGSTKVGQIVAEGCAKTNKKAMVLAGAKNTMIVTKDANLQGFAENFKNACFGAAGQRCMAAANVLVEEEIYDTVKKHYGGRSQKRCRRRCLRRKYLHGTCDFPSGRRKNS